MSKLGSSRDCGNAATSAADTNDISDDDTIMMIMIIMITPADTDPWNVCTELGV